MLAIAITNTIKIYDLLAEKKNKKYVETLQ